MLNNSPDDDFPAWYQEVIAKAELSENAPVRGTIVIRPYAYAIWELMQSEMDRRIKAAGAENAYFPLLIPESYLAREADHVEGFSPELAVVTHAGGSLLEEPLVIRPTSETIIGEFMAKWTNSYRDLPLLLNQWANVVRWEKRPRAFLRTTEFLWQEGHTAHATEADAAGYARRILDDVYADFMRNVLAVPVFSGQKSPGERFAGATNTMTCEGMMGDGKALQMATSHELGQNFARAFDVGFTSATGAREIAWTTSWGSSTRMMGGLFMAHGDAHGLRLPPAVAPYQVVVVQIGEEPEVGAAAARVSGELGAAGVRVKVDRDHARSVGARLTDWEIKGVPLRVDLGAKEVAGGILSVLRRDTLARIPIGADDVAAVVPRLLSEIQAGMLEEARRRRDDRTAVVDSIPAAAEQATSGFAVLPWRELADGGEEELQKSAITVRCISTPDGEVPTAGQLADAVAVVARAY